MHVKFCGAEGFVVTGTKNTIMEIDGVEHTTTSDVTMHFPSSKIDTDFGIVEFKMTTVAAADLADLINQIINQDAQKGKPYISPTADSAKLVETVDGHFENDNYVFFWNGPFSNWHSADFYMETGTEYGKCFFTSSEQAMMFYKAHMFDDKDAIVKVMSTNSPREQKAIGRKVKNFNQETWEASCIDIVTDILVNKFTSDEELLKVLLDTRDKTIVEASPLDKIWGIGMGVDHPDILDESKWDGKNYLGICLMKARDWILNI